MTGRRPAVLALGLHVLVRALTAVTVGLAAVAQGRPFLRPFTGWDATWYSGIAAHGYGFVRQAADGRLLADYAFFPLYPATERLVSALTGLAYPVSGLVVSALTSVLAAAGIFAVARDVLGPRAAVVVVLLWTVLPVAVVQTMAYSESLFTALAAWCLYAVLRERWLTAAVLACAAGLTRPVGAAVVVAVMVTAVATWPRTRAAAGTPAADRHSGGRLAAILVAPLGLLGYLGWVAHATSNVQGYFAVTRGWGNEFDGGVSFALWVARRVLGEPLAGAALLVGLATLVVLVVACLRQRQPLALVVYTVVLTGLALTTSAYFGSKPRYLLPAFPLLLPVAAWLARRPTWLTAALLTAAAAGSTVYAVIWLLGPGPP